MKTNFPMIEFHILQSFPVSCLNRDDVGSPKSCIVGGVQRARVSSQCWKRAVRLALHDQGVNLGVRTKLLSAMIEEKLVAEQADPVQAKTVAEAMGKAICDDTLLFFTQENLQAMVDYAQSIGLDAKLVKEGDIAKLCKKFNKEPLNGLDIALFGRMVAKATTMNVEAAASFSHAISTHAMNGELDFFTALDDKSEVQGSAHMGTLEFTSATYYRYVSLNVNQLVQTLGLESEHDVKTAVAAFIKALYVAVPAARQTTMSAASLWDFARVYVRRGPRLQCAFDLPVKAHQEGYIRPSVTAMLTELDAKQKQAGSLIETKLMVDFGRKDDKYLDETLEGLIEKVTSQLE